MKIKQFNFTVQYFAIQMKENTIQMETTHQCDGFTISKVHFNKGR